jgi:chaperonin GroES
MNLIPLADRLVVRREDNVTVTASGIVIPGSAAEKADQGTVLAVGPGKRNNDGDLKPIDVAVGDTVLFGRHAGQEVEVDKQTYLMLKADDVLAVVTLKNH